ncbi:TrkH family potassium uptake protein [Neptuniibacter sp. CAU 1671]|uniref:TrkH family potassium uptake protein n=1 Tax=Neptuniibacter sp. CAU 1671 TaxID=3032593 RepID=UPI0023DAD278|nr:TrkH family potassium uptake protein [Neptuniibacter sp. CAU 1671]MDF2180456.1 TrkH family potassium uptake protein [Neptuniibacter sp. CAU 1671]
MLKLFKPVFYVCGLLSLMMAAMLLLPTTLGWFHQDSETHAFLVSAGISFIAGVFLIAAFRPRKFSLGPRQLYLLTCCSWALLSVIGALPLIFGHDHIRFTDAVFESVSGITTTGSTILTGLEYMPHSLLLWRALLQWIGGLGVIGMAVSILPFLHVGGMRLFQTESSDWSDKSLPRLADLARSLFLVYMLITTGCILGYWINGMNLFDAISHALTTVSTGGFATDDRSMGRFGPAILWVSVLFMLLGALPFVMFIRLLTQPSLKVFLDQQVRGFLLIVAVLTLIMTLYLIGQDIYGPFEALTQAAFNIVSVITTTGFASTDYTLWGGFSLAFFFFVTFIGGCSGSTSGGMKVFRFQLSFMFLIRQIKLLVHPRGIFSIRYNGKEVEDDIIFSAVAFSFLFFMVLVFTTMVLALTGLDFVTSITGAATALTNVGPGLGDIIGPAGNFAPLSDTAKWVLSFAMLLGRLELLSIMVLFSGVFWRG